MSLFESSATRAKKGHFGNLVTMALSDGRLDESELKLIVRIGLRIGLTENQVRQIISDPSKTKFEIPKSEKLRLSLLIDYVSVMIADGKIDPREASLCSVLARKLGFDPDTVIPVILDGFLDTTPSKPEKDESSVDSGTEKITIDSAAFLSDRGKSDSPRPRPEQNTAAPTGRTGANPESKPDEIRVAGFAVSIPEGEKTLDDYFLLSHNQNYSITLRNYSSRKCDADLEIDGKDMGTFRVPANSCATFDRPAHDDGRFTFYELMSKEGNSVGLKANQNLGLVSVTFRPEVESTMLFAARPPDMSLRMGQSSPSDPSTERDSDTSGAAAKSLPTLPRAGGTALTGKSNQRLHDAEQIKHDPHAAVIIHLRLGARIVSRPSEPRPLTSHPRSNKIPPPLS